MTIKQIIKDNPQGFTLDMTTQDFAIHKVGYYVAITDNRIEDLEVWNDEAFLKAHNLFKSICNRDNVYIGGWCANELKGIYCVDFTLYFKLADKKLALATAKAFNQEAVYDIENQTSIYL